MLTAQYRYSIQPEKDCEHLDGDGVEVNHQILRYKLHWDEAYKVC